MGYGSNKFNVRAPPLHHRRHHRLARASLGRVGGLDVQAVFGDVKVNVGQEGGETLKGGHLAVALQVAFDERQTLKPVFSLDGL
jgi:hypothetical protein